MWHRIFGFHEVSRENIGIRGIVISLVEVVITLRIFAVKLGQVIPGDLRMQVMNSV